MPFGRSGDMLRLAGALGAVAGVTLAFRQWLSDSNAATVSITLLLIVLIAAATSHFWVAVVTSVAAMLDINFFFLPPTGTLTIADPHNWVALFVFMAVSLVAGNLSAAARSRAQEAVARRDELARLFDLSRDVLLMNEGREAVAQLSHSIARRFDLEYVAIALPPGEGDWDIHEAGASTIDLDRAQLANVLAAAQTLLEFDAASRTYAGHRVTALGGHHVRLVPLRARTTPVGVLAAAGRPVEAGTLDALAGIAAIAIERASLLEARKAGELARQREELQTALLASLGHDLRTPLTAIRVAASNIRSRALSETERDEQSDLILSETEHLTRLFQDILDMARIDAGAVATEPRWAHPSEIVAAARDQVEHSLRQHVMDVQTESDALVRLDPRLTAAALAHVLENAAQYSPGGSAIRVLTKLQNHELVIEVLDRGSGIAPRDLAHLFDRFYRGDSGVRARASGTGLGLWIARGLLAAERGRIWADDHPRGGAQFTIAVPGEVRQPVTERSSRA
jgi:two-component system sensor histidine kinase KdpD